MAVHPHASFAYLSLFLRATSCLLQQRQIGVGGRQTGVATSVGKFVTECQPVFFDQRAKTVKRSIVGVEQQL
jgi:hypothetical protein